MELVRNGGVVELPIVNTEKKSGTVVEEMNKKKKKNGDHDGDRIGHKPNYLH